MDQTLTYEQILVLFRNQQYAAALTQFSRLLDDPHVSDLIRLRALRNVADCLMELHERNIAPAGWMTSFRTALAEYLHLLRRIPPREISPAPLREMFTRALRFVAASEPHPETLPAVVEATFGAFLEVAQGIVTPEQFTQDAVREIERERMLYTHADHAARAEGLARGVLASLTPEELPHYQSAILDRLADLAYFFPRATEDESQRYNRVMELLNRSLRQNPRNDFARTMLRHVQRLASTTLQIKRFGHDTRNRVGNIRQLLNDLEQGSALPAAAQPLLAALRKQFEDLTLIHHLVEGQQPGPAQWDHIDPVALVTPCLQDLGLPHDCVSTHGDPGTWELCPDLTRLAISNVLLNSLEAYQRTTTSLPPSPVRISINYQNRTMDFQDTAGGVDAALGDVFAPYVSSKPVRGNVGLGLTQARDAVRLQSSRFELFLPEPQPEHGATFRMSFPLLD